MKIKSLLTLAAATAATAAFTGAQAQSSVTVFGVIDTGVVRMSTSGNSRTAVQSDGNTSNRLGFRGVEDLQRARSHERRAPADRARSARVG